MKQPTLKLSFVRTAVVCAAFSWAMPAAAADFEFTPSLSVSEEYNDNILDSALDEKSDFVTRIQPGAVLSYRAPSFKGGLSYHFEYQKYARGTMDDEQVHNLALRGKAELVDNFFFLELSDTFSRVSQDVARDVTTESLNLNQTDQNVANVSPYLLWRLGSKSTLKTGYRFTDTSYWGSPGIDKRENWLFADLSHEPAPRLNLTAGYAYGRANTDLADYDQHNVSSGFRYEYAGKSFLYGGVGNSWQAFSDDISVSNLFWHAGISKDFSPVVATLETRVQYTEDPLTISTKETSYSARLEKTLEHGSIGISSTHAKYQDTRTDAPDRRKTAVSGFMRYEMSPRLTTSVILTGDKVSRRTSQDYPYHFSGTVGGSYGFNYDISVSLYYSYIDYRSDLDSAAGARQTNRVVLTLKKTF